MRIEKHLLKAVQSAYIPAILSEAYTYTSNYFFNNGLQQDNIKNHKPSHTIHSKAVKSFFASMASENFCSPLKSNFILHTVCSETVKSATSYGVDKGYKSLNNMFFSQDTLENHEYEISEQEESDNHFTHGLTSFSQS